MSQEQNVLSWNVIEKNVFFLTMTLNTIHINHLCITNLPYVFYNMYFFSFIVPFLLPHASQIIYDRLMAQLAQCQFAAAKTERTSQMIDEELLNYQKLSQTIEKSIEAAKQEIDESKKELVTAKQIRKNKMEYDQLAKVIKQQPDRKETQKHIETLQKELAEHNDKKLKLERKFEKRQKDFSVLMYAVRELEAQLAEDSSSDEETSKSDEEEMVGSSSKPTIINLTLLEGLSDDEMEAGSQTGKSRDRGFLERSVEDKIEIKDDDDVKSIKEPMSVDEDVVLELSIEKDENDVKMDEVVLSS